MNMKEMDWKAIEQAVFEMQRGSGHLMDINTLEGLKEMEYAIYQFWSRFKRVVEMKELIEHESQYYDGGEEE